MKKRMNETNSIKTKCIISMIMIYPILLIFQGMDITDTGFYLTSYQQIFTAPKNLRYEFLYWLSDVIGGIWLKLFGDLGYIGIRLAWVLIIWIILFCYYKVLYKYISKEILLTGFFVMLIFTSNNLHTLDYNILTTLFYALGSISLFYGIIKDKKFLIFLGGFVLGASLFLRLPNILGLTLMIAILYYGFLKKTAFRSQVRQCLYFVIGYLMSIALILVLMKLIGHLNYYLDSLKFITQIGESSKSTHGIGNLILLLLNNYFSVAKYTILYGSIIIGASLLIIPFLNKCKFSRYAYIFVFLLSLILWSRWYSFDSYRDCIYAMNGFMDIVLVFYIFNIFKMGNEFRLIALFGLLILTLTPLGSDNGIYNSIFGMWISGVILIWTIFRLDTLINIKNTSLKNNLNNLSRLVCIVFVAFCLIQGYRYTYRDSVNRLSMKYTINNKYLKCTVTTKDRAKVMNELLNQTKKYVKKNENLLAYSDIQLIYYLTETKPYLYTSFVRAYNDDKFVTTLQEAENENRELPTIIIQTIDTKDRNWPQLDNKLFVTNMKASIRYKTIKSFMNKHDYKLKWSNSCFQIWKIT
jgi:hypothetical protein